MTTDRLRRLVLALVPLLAASCEINDPRPAKETPTSPRPAQAPAPSQTLKEKALLGDTLAAEAVAKYYRATGDAALYERWADVAAENGSMDQMIAYGLRLGDVGGRENCIRAIFWLEKAQHQATVRGASEAERRAIGANIEHVKTRDHCGGVALQR